MSKRSKLSTEEKLKVVERYLNGESPTKLASEFKLNDETIRLWTKKYETFEISGLEEKMSWTKYPKELKVSAVEDYLNGVGSLINICNKYGIRDHSTLRDWILKYNTSEELKSYPKGSSKSMKKGRKTTHRERIEIAKYCIENDYNYTDAANIYEVSYQQVYSWVKKFEEFGEKGLIDKRGKSKDEVSLTEEDRLAAEIIKLKKQNRELEVENALLKKLEELEKRYR
jgi:transposase